MNTKMMNKVMKYLILISAIAVFVGAIFQLQHYPFGDMILITGLLSHFLISSFEINRLKKIIGTTEK
ncbi:MAG TPA: hypothetical protein VFC65_12045 [Prolixibacteraceae bacterium]|nr:hypothetical protein [Prolixibacteraceae bacterium]